MKFGVMFANTAHYATAEGAAAIATAADECGIESIWSVEHVVIPHGYQSRYPYHESGKIPGGEDPDIPDPLIWLAYAAAVTKQVKLATGILIVPQRNPVVLAKECASLHKLSNGRFELGIGVGWLQEEFECLGVPWPDRGRRTDEYCAAMAALWSQDKAAYDGRYAKFSNAISRPQPVGGSVPIVVGGHSDAAAKRAGRYGTGFFPASGTDGELAHLFEVMKAEAEAHGRNGNDIEVTTMVWSPRRESLDRVKELEDLGVHRLVVAPPTSNPTKIRQAMEQLAETVAPVATR
ncbi:MAG: LLM class F420-dependent oxidoreductase [Acidimicrobiia bacterium]|nr:LLM class F420-dependent oxidoreductase [Acidimicrobiia bacterium]MDH4362667.1 LLM class F420-dependent oxidoreductase [Acidimicrobiia bacterium]MDH5290168.1 LLM class F420-dependent oxidoreductase [Acidimicrobiia bacterium]